MLSIGERDELVVLYERLEDAKTGFKEALAAVAEKHGYQPANVRKYVVALARDQAEQARADAQEVLDLFEREADGFPDDAPSARIEVVSVGGKRVKPRPAESFEGTLGGQKIVGWTQ